MPKWVKTDERLPESWPYDEPGAPSYTVQCTGYSPVQAMFLDGEWYTSYISKIIVPVAIWLEDIEKDA